MRARHEKEFEKECKKTGGGRGPPPLPGKFRIGCKIPVLKALC
jgi:hypothetical protein